MIEPGSFRDPDARVFYQEGRVLRGLTGAAAATDQRVRETGLMDLLVDRRLFVNNWLVEDVKPPEGIPSDTVIEARRVPVISYPAEWSFSMLKDAALLTLEANIVALDAGFVLKDASAFNVVFDGATPTIIDVTSLDEFGDRGIWTAYSQFCDHFLAPLMLEAYTGVSFQPMLRDQVEGIPIVSLNRLLRGRSGIHKGVLSHVRLRSRLENRAVGMATEKRRDVGQMSLPRSSVIATIRKMKKLVAELESTAPSTWAGYEAQLPYAEPEGQAKIDFVRQAAGQASDHGLAVDVGANAGLFTKILSEHFDHVIGIDNDPGAIDALYGHSATTGNLTPLVVDITNPTPAFGWRGQERSAFTDRVRPSFATWLAVVHHLCLGVGLPLESVVAQIFEFSPESVVEFVDSTDPMAQRISASRVGELTPYSRDLFEQYVAHHGQVIGNVEVSPHRTAYHLRRS